MTTVFIGGDTIEVVDMEGLNPYSEGAESEEYNDFKEEEK